MAGKRQAYSIIELIIVMSILAALAFVAVPKFHLSAVYRQKADAAAAKIVTDLRRTRRLAISDAAGNTDGFELKMVGSSPYTEYEIENRNTSETVDSHTIDSNVNVSCPGNREFEFGPLGNLLTSSGTEITVSAEGKSFTITIVSATGMIKCVEN